MNEIKEINEKNINEMNILSLSFVGDAVHTLFIRNKILKSYNLLAGDYHAKCVKYCNAGAQAKAYDVLFDDLTVQEQEIAKRARNAKSHKAKNSSIENYKKATAFEAVIGYLYLLEKQERLNEILEKSFEIVHNKGESQC